ncbi:hypothetical protein ZHAS_00014471 [Anopheles sinensis]|uniref:Uncharacterized protein n=1 Tax=Anopheles sinensis TaxID=74873 RepID=A0A084W8E0_ANOSI|nr:hypothetical protein ZHAS_00014471 [Anopheles sinensis]
MSISTEIQRISLRVTLISEGHSPTKRNGIPIRYRSKAQMSSCGLISTGQLMSQKASHTGTFDYRVG